MSRRRRNRDQAVAAAELPDGQPYAKTAQEERQAYMDRLRALERERAMWLPRWVALADYIEPGAVRVFPSDRFKAPLDSPLVVNNTPLLGIRAMAAGMMSGLTSPSRPWFKLTLPDLDLARFQPVAEWLQTVERVLQISLARSNVYTSLAKIYKHLGGWGTACAVLDEGDDWRGSGPDFHCYVYPIGSFYLANGPENDVEAVYLRFIQSVSQLVQQFGLDSVSSQVRQMYERRNYDAWIEVVRVIETNELPDPRKIDYGGMPVRACWFEYGIGGGDDRGKAGLLRRNGYREWPCMTPRWETSASDAYGRGPGIQGQGDFDMLQLVERRKLQLLDMMVQPATLLPAALKQHMSGRGLMPGEKLYVDNLGPGMVGRPVFEVPAAGLPAAREEVAEIQNRIRQITFYDLWLALSQDDRRQPMTAREVAERHEEKLTQLGPVVDNVHGELLDPLIERAFGILLRHGRIPQPPDELRGQPLRVEYISVLAQAQKLVGIGSLERFMADVGHLSAEFPEVKDKIAVDKIVEDLADAMGIDADTLVPQEKVDAIRAQRAQAQQQHAAVTEQIPAAAQSAKVLADTDVANTDSALNRLLQAQGAGAFPAGAA